VAYRLVVLVLALDAARRRQPRPRHRRVGPAAQHDVTVGGQCVDQRREQAGRVGPRRDLVDVVDHEAHLPR
jgi:hypothetical protein